MDKSYYVYILASKKHGTLYVGVTGNLQRRIYEHKQGLVDGFTKKYDVKNLVWYEDTDSIEGAIEREKQIKVWKRQWKINLIEKDNLNWVDLYDELEF